MIRAKAFSSRSSASEPATSSTVTNISVTVAATAIANVSSAAVSPATTCLSTSIGCGDRAQQRQREVEVLARRGSAKLDHLGRAPRAAGLVGGSSARDRLEDRRRALEPEDVERRRAAGAELAALDQQVEVVGRLVGDPLREDQVGLGDQRLDPVVDELRLDRVVLVDEHLDRRLLGVERRPAS